MGASSRMALLAEALASAKQESAVSVDLGADSSRSTGASSLRAAMEAIFRRPISEMWKLGALWRRLR
jgi:hypothetical protein